MNNVPDAGDILGFEKLAVKHNSSMIGVLEGGYLDEEHGFKLSDGEVMTEDDQLPLEPKAESGEPAEEPSPGVRRADPLGGDIPALLEGKTFKHVESGRPNAQFGEFLDSLVAQFAAGLDISPAFFLDAKLTGPNARTVNGKAQRKFDQRQNTLCRFTEWVWARLIGRAIEAGELPSVDGWWRVTFQRPARLTIDAGREAQQERDDQSADLMTRQELYGNRARDWQQGTDRCFVEVAYIIERAKELAAKTDVPVEIVLVRFAFSRKRPPRRETFLMGKGEGEWPNPPKARLARPQRYG